MIYVQRILGPAVSPGSAKVNFVTPLASDKLRATGNEILLVRGAGTVTVKTTPDSLGRVGDIVITVAAGEVFTFGPVLLSGFQTPDGNIDIVTTGTVEVALVGYAR
jgi:hypothetical protein